MMNRRRFVALSAAASVVPASAVSGEVPMLSFGLITDIQYADADPEGERHYRESPGKLRTAVEFLSKAGLPFSLHLGDLIDRDFKSFDTVLPLLGGLGHPVRHLLGNHDYDVADGEKGKVAGKLGMPADYYSFKAGGVKFVMLDTNEVSIYKHPEGSPGDLAAEATLARLQAEDVPGAKKWNGGLSNTQLAWLDAELAAADAAKEPVILCGHHPLLPAEMHQAWNPGEVAEVIDRHPCVRAYFNGHNHAGAQVVRNGVPHVTFKSLLHEPGVTAFSVVRVFKDKIAIEGRGREISRIIPI